MREETSVAGEDMTWLDCVFVALISITTSILAMLAYDRITKREADWSTGGVIVFKYENTTCKTARSMMCGVYLTNCKNGKEYTCANYIEIAKGGK